MLSTEKCYFQRLITHKRGIFLFVDGGAGKARFNVATPTNATVTCTVTAYVLPYNFQTKSIYHYFKRGSTLNLDGFSVKIIFHII